MVAKLTCPQNISRALNYNEQKVHQGKAECLYAGNFLKDAGELNFYEKLHRFEHQNALNERAKTNTLHISLNFDAGDQLDREKLLNIASAYMEKIGFGRQPYLVYQHHDAGHTHIHIVTSSIEKDGKRINTYNIGKDKSEKARKDLEQEYVLVQAQSKKQEQKAEPTPVEQWQQSFDHRAASAQKVQYGKMETRRAITNVLDAVVNQYKYTSLAELNAVLKLYNVMADRGKEDSRLYQMKGLYYRVLDEGGNKIGVPIKASAFHMKPTLKYLEQKFAANEVLRQPYKQRIKTMIDWTLAGSGHTLSTLEMALKKEGIQVVVRRNEEGKVFGMTYVDVKNKVVFNGSDLGKEYSAKGLVERLANRMMQEEVREQKSGQKFTYIPRKEKVPEITLADEKEKSTAFERAMEIVLRPLEQPNYIPGELLKKKRKKKHSRGLHW